MLISFDLYLCVCVRIGTFTILSIMIGSVTERLAPDSDFLIYNGTNVTEEVDIISRDFYRVQVAAAATVLGGLIQVINTHTCKHRLMLTHKNVYTVTHNIILYTEVHLEVSIYCLSLIQSCIFTHSLY